MIEKGQLRFMDKSQAKVQFHYKKDGSNAQSRALEFDKLPMDLQTKLKAKPDGVGLSLPITDNRQIDVAALAPGGGPIANQVAVVTRSIRAMNGDWVELDTPESIQREKINITDPSLGLQAGNRIGAGRFLIPLVTFGAAVDGLGGQIPNIDRNPYNFVEFAGSGPWVEPADTNATHAVADGKRLSGVLSFEMKALTPIFVPGGFPFGREEREAEETRRTPRHFCRMPNAAGEVCYAIPGSSVKGLLRSEIEALSNSRLGVLLDEEFFNKAIPYRRRSFRAGEINRFDSARNEWEVQEVDVLYLHPRDWPGGGRVGTTVAYGEVAENNKRFAIPDPSSTQTGKVRGYYAGLAVAETKKPYVGLILKPGGAKVWLPETIKKAYVENLKHPHYENHKKSEAKAKVKKYANINRSEREGLKPGDLIYYTAEGGKVTTFGKNINYLWPSSQSVTGLCKPWQTPKRLGLEDPLCMAERLFGFSGDLTRDGESHHFRGLLRFETAWGPAAQDYEAERQWEKLERGTGAGVKTRTGWRVELAALTGPVTRAKARPLYLQPLNGRSGSWEDSGVKLRGRKFYWPQADPTGPGGMWKFHLRDPLLHQNVENQLPPPIHVLGEGTAFSCRIHFRNLTKAELGAVIYVLEGKGEGHTLRIGKGKPRGLGNVRCNSVEVAVDTSPEGLLDATPGEAARGDTAGYVAAFQDWVKGKAGGKAEFGEIEHIRSYDHLHWWKEGEQQIRYYPINFKQYGWLPGTDLGNAKGEPDTRDGRPPGMKRAGELG